MKSFSTKSEMLEYGKSFGKYDMEKVLLNGKIVFLCGTNLAYEDTLFEIANDALDKSKKLFSIDDTEADSVSELRDSIFESVKKIFNIEIAEVSDEY